ncbi:MAG: hypothetical protein ACREGR_01580 [Minisyncoccia bacterium]
MVSGIIAVPAYLLMGWDVVMGRTKQNIAAWIVWALLDVITLLASFAAGNKAPWLIAAFAGGSVFILSLSLWRGDWKWELTETACIAAASLALGLWWYFGPTWAIACSVAAMVAAGIPMLWDTWRRPHEQIATTWIVFFLACVVLFIGAPWPWTIAFALYPGAGVLYNGAMVLLSLRKKQTVENTAL